MGTHIRRLPLYSLGLHGCHQLLLMVPHRHTHLSSLPLDNLFRLCDLRQRRITSAGQSRLPPQRRSLRRCHLRHPRLSRLRLGIAMACCTVLRHNQSVPCWLPAMQEENIYFVVARDGSSLSDHVQRGLPPDPHPDIPGLFRLRPVPFPLIRSAANLKQDRG